MKPMRHYNIPIFIPHLGCPYDCIYCDQKKISAQMQIPGAAEVVGTIEQYLQTIPLASEVELAFFGGNFTAIPEAQQIDYLQLIQPYLESGRIQGIRISTRPDCIDVSGLQMLISYGVKTIELGVQSLDDEVLRLADRKYQAEDVYKSAALIQAHGFQLGLQLMVGLPGDNYARTLQTVRASIKINPQMVRIYPTLVIAGTKLEQMWLEGKYQALTLEDAIHICKDILLYFSAANIPVIRMGLYPGEELRSAGVVKAGPFHPAFRELAEQAIFKDQAALAIKTYIAHFQNEKSLCLMVEERDLSKMLGKNRSNLHYLRNYFALGELQLQTSRAKKQNWVGVRSASSEIDEFRLTREEYIQKQGIAF